MSKSLKLGTLVNLRKSAKGSDVTKDSPSMNTRRTKTNNLRKMQGKSKRIQNLLSFQSEDEPLIVSREVRKKNDLLRSEIIERQKKMGKHRGDTIRSVSMVMADNDKHPVRKKLSSHTKKRSAKKVPISLGKKDAHRKLEFPKNQKNSKSRKTEFAPVNGGFFKTQNTRMRASLNTLPKKSQSKAYTMANKSRAMNPKKRQKAGRPMAQKKQSQSRGSKRGSGNPKPGYLGKHYGKTPKKRASDSRKSKESRRSIDNIYKRSHSTKQNKDASQTIYQGKAGAGKQKYFTEHNRNENTQNRAEQRVQKKRLQGEDFENIYEFQKEPVKGEWDD